MKVSLYVKSWPIQGSFTISRGSKTQAEVIIVKLEQQGVIGRGECVPCARYGESIDSVLSELESLFQKLSYFSNYILTFLS